MEKCRNPFKPEPCENQDIVLYIRKDNETYPICRSCWASIADSDLEWHGSEASLETALAVPKEMTGTDVQPSGVLPEASTGQA